MENFKKSHLWGGLAFFVLLVALNLSPWIVEKVKAAKGDIETFQLRGTDAFRVTGTGGVVSSSPGISNDAGLWIGHESVAGLAPSSSSLYIGYDAKVATGTLVCGTCINGSTSSPFGHGSTTYIETDPVFSQPRYPRNIMIEVFGASGSAIIKGTDTFNRQRTETIFYISTQAARGVVAWMGISSITVNVDTVSINQTSVTFAIGSGAAYGLPFRVDNATDVIRIYEGGVFRSSFTATNSTAPVLGSTFTTPSNSSVGFSSPIVNTSECTINFSSNTFGGGKSLDVWAIVRRSIFSAPTPPSSVFVSTP